MNTGYTPDEIRSDALNTYKVLSMTHTLQQNIDTSFCNLAQFSDKPNEYSFIFWSRVNSMFVEDLLANKELV